jgi:hypothetical protein
VNSRPTTQQVIVDARRELAEVIAPQLTSESAQLSARMLDTVLENLATRAAHEVAWMREEAAAIEELADEVVAADVDGAAVVDGALGAYRTGRTGGLHLDEAVADYSLAGRVLSEVCEVVMRSGSSTLRARLEEVLRQRLDHEVQIMGDWGFIGRG